MNRQDIIDFAAERHFLTKTEVNETIQLLLDTIAKELKDGQRIYIRNFGSLHKVKRQARAGYDFEKEKPITVPARETVEFRPAAALLEKINK